MMKNFCFALLVVLLVPAGPSATITTGFRSYQVGTWGDNGSRRNFGISVEIRTHIYEIDEPRTPPRSDYFWVGNTLTNGAFIQFGYAFNPGYYCLKGRAGSNSTCSGNGEIMGISDARWEREYFPNASDVSDFYYEIGSSGSVGSNGTWHSYVIVPDSRNGWSFLLDGNEVSSIDLPFTEPVPSFNPVHEVAEQITAGRLGKLGPVEFSNLSYRTIDGSWRQVSSLLALSGCSIGSICDVENPYGVDVLGPNHIIVGSGILQHQNGELLWPQGIIPALSDPRIRTAVGLALAIGLVLLPVMVYLLLRRHRMRKSTLKP